MTRRDEVLTLLTRNPDGLSDAEPARLTGASHQTVNQNIQADMIRHLSTPGRGHTVGGRHCLLSMWDRHRRVVGRSRPAHRGQGLAVGDLRRFTQSRRGQETSPSVQASHWFAGAVLSTLRLRGRHLTDRVLMVFPDYSRYRKLSDETAGTLRVIGIEIWLVEESGAVSAHTE